MEFLSTLKNAEMVTEKCKIVSELTPEALCDELKALSLSNLPSDIVICLDNLLFDEALVKLLEASNFNEICTVLLGHEDVVAGKLLEVLNRMATLRMFEGPAAAMLCEAQLLPLLCSQAVGIAESSSAVIQLLSGQFPDQVVQRLALSSNKWAELPSTLRLR